MPTTRKRRTRGRSVVTLQTIGLPARLDLMAGWRPPVTAFERTRSRWTTYREFLDDFRAVRDEFLVRHPLRSDVVTFAEVLHQRVSVDPRGDVEAIGALLYAEMF